MRRSTSRCSIPAMSKAMPPATDVAVTVRSGIWLMMLWLAAEPTPRTYTGGLARCRARSALAITKAPAPSVRRQQSSLCSGVQMYSEASTSSIVSGSRNRARGLRVAHSRVETAICASCSEVVPNCAMWREAASA